MTGQPSIFTPMKNQHTERPPSNIETAQWRPQHEIKRTQPRMAKTHWKWKTMRLSRDAKKWPGWNQTQKSSPWSPPSKGTRNSGVRNCRPFSLVVKFLAVEVGRDGKQFSGDPHERDFSPVAPPHSWNQHFKAGDTRKPPKMYKSQSKRLMSSIPSQIITPRMSSAPRMPQKSTRCWYCGGNTKVGENQRNDENVVHGQRDLDEVAGKKLQRLPAAAPETPATRQTGPPA